MPLRSDFVAVFLDPVKSLLNSIESSVDVGYHPSRTVASLKVEPTCRDPGLSSTVRRSSESQQWLRVEKTTLRWRPLQLALSRGLAFAWRDRGGRIVPRRRGGCHSRSCQQLSKGIGWEIRWLFRSAIQAVIVCEILKSNIVAESRLDVLIDTRSVGID